MIIFNVIGIITVYCYFHMLIFGGKIKISLNNPFKRRNENG
jgi:hypothetical protein